VNGHGDVVELNKDPITGRALELHDNVAILARWVHMQGLMSRELPGYDSQTIFEEVYRNTLVPYFQNLTHQPPAHDQIVRFWTFLDLEYTEYWFYFLQVADVVPLYRMTVALQRLQVILHQLSPEAEMLPNMNSTLGRGDYLREPVAQPTDLIQRLYDQILLSGSRSSRSSDVRPFRWATRTRMFNHFSLL
jgi:hypothetical protein